MEDAGTKMEAMAAELREAENAEQMAGVLDRIAHALGNGFLKGEFSYFRMQEIKETIEQAETERREFFARAAGPKRPVHSR